MIDFYTRLCRERLLSVDTVLDFRDDICFGIAMKWITRDQLMDLMVLTTEQFHDLYLYHNSTSPSVCVCVCVAVCHFAYSSKTKQATVLKFSQMTDNIVGSAHTFFVTLGQRSRSLPRSRSK